MHTTTLRSDLQEIKKAVRLMGNIFELTAVSDNADKASNAMESGISEISRIEQLFTTFSETSLTNKINRYAGVSPVTVCEEMFQLIKRSLAISSVTDGAFDITYGSVEKSFWNFDTTMQSLPDPARAAQSVRLINYRNVILDEKNFTVFLKEKGMRIGFGGIGKGYAAEQAKIVMKQSGIESGIVNASGDLCTWGVQADGNPWTIGIANPDNAELPFSYLNISDKAIATSGNYAKYVVIDGKKYSHTINPKTGMPVSGIKSVTVIAPHAELADAMATPVTIMGVKAGLNLINQLPHLGCIIIDDYNKLFYSDNINIH